MTTNNNAPKGNTHSILPPSSNFSLRRATERERRKKRRESKSDGSNNVSSRVHSFEREEREREHIKTSKQERMARDNKNNGVQE
jgi:hypothetical protein